MCKARVPSHAQQGLASHASPDCRTADASCFLQHKVKRSATGLAHFMRKVGRALRVGLGANKQQLAVRKIQQRGVGRRDPRISACTFQAC